MRGTFFAGKTRGLERKIRALSQENATKTGTLTPGVIRIFQNDSRFIEGFHVVPAFFRAKENPDQRRADQDFGSQGGPEVRPLPIIW